MLTIFKAIVLAVVQGITEWLPISSSGHLVIFQKIFGLNDQIAYDLLLHIATALVVVFIFRKDILNIIKSLWQAVVDFEQRKSWHAFIENEERKLAMFVIIGSIPIAVFGLTVKDLVEKSFENLLMVAVAFFFTGFLLWLTKFRVNRYAAKGSGIKGTSFLDAFFVGVFQALAIFPGVSRSGSTIAGGMITGLDKNLAARYSFLLFLPAITGAVILELDRIVFAASEVPAVIIGCIVAMVTSYLAIETLLQLVKHGKFHLFSYYCWFAGLVSLGLFFVL